MTNVHIRPITAEDNPFIAAIIRQSLTDFDAAKPGTVFYDTSTDHLFELFSATTNAAYWIATVNQVIVGGCGLYPTAGLPNDTIELVKMYVNAAYRGKGIGKKLLQSVIREAAMMGYKQIYLETLPELQIAVKAYEQLGFQYLASPLGNSGHFGCDIWMVKQVTDAK